MLQKALLFISIACCVCLSANVYAQEARADSALRVRVAGNAIRLYTTSLAENIHLYNGAEYTATYYNLSGHPFFISDSFQKGVIHYDGILYHDVPMQYDLVTGEIVINGYLNLKTSLVTDKILYFSLLDHLFIRPGKDSDDPMISAGFYDVRYDGKVALLVRRQKNIERSLRPEDPYIIKQYDQFIVKKDLALHFVHNKNSLLALLQDHRRELEKFIRMNKLNFKKDLENAIWKTIEYYDQLKN